MVKFRDAAQVHLRGGWLVSLAGQDLSVLLREMHDHGPARIEPLFGRDETGFDQTRRSAEARSGKRLPDRNTYVTVSTRPAESESLLRALLALPIV